MNKTKRLSLCGVLAALAVAMMFLGGVVPFATIACPILTSLVLLPVFEETGAKWGFLWYGAVALLSLFIAPDKEAAILFVVFGCYPILHKFFARLPVRILRWPCKLLYLNGTVIAAYSLMLHVFVIASVQQDFQDLRGFMLVLSLLLGNVSFVLYDFLLDRLVIFYHVKLRPKLKL